MLVLDTNVYLDASIDAELAVRIAGFIEESGEQVGLSSVVLGELLMGVKPRERERLVSWVTAGIPDEAIVTPVHADWMAAGDVLQRLGGSTATKGRSFWNDLLIATSCARAGATLLTRNMDDFRRIRRFTSLNVRSRPD